MHDCRNTYTHQSVAAIAALNHRQHILLFSNALALDWGCDSGGKRRRKTIYGQTKGEVQEKLRALQNSAASGTLNDSSTISLAKYLEHWLNGPAKESVGETTWPRYEQLVRLRIKPSIGGFRLTKLTPMHIEQMRVSCSRWNGMTSTSLGGV